jgi:integrase
MLRELVPLAATTADLTTATFTTWLNSYPGRGANTQLGYLGYMRAICRAAWEDGYLDRCPSWRRLRPRPTPPATAHALPWTDVVRLLDFLESAALAGTWTDRRLYALVATVAYTGLRRDEALFLRLVDADLTAGFLLLQSTADRPLKTPSSGQPVPICPELAEILEAWSPSAGPVHLFPGVKRRSAWHGGSPGYRPIDHLRAAAAAAGVPPLGWHDLRHTWATHAESRWGIDGPVIQRVLRQTSLKTTARYRHADLENLSRIAPQITYRSP